MGGVPMRATSAGILLACLAIFAGCSFSQDEAFTLQLRHGAPSTMPMHRALLQVSELLNARTSGRIRLEVHAGLVLPYQLDDMIKGDHEIAMSGMASLADYYRPLGVLEAPYMFRDVEHFYRSVASPFWQTLGTEVERRSGLHVIDMWHQGFRQVTLRDKPAYTPDDFRTIKLRVPATQMYVEAARALGALPTTMGLNDVRTAIRAGTVDGQENPLPTIKAMRLHEACKYLILTNHTITPIMPIINASYWQSLNPADRAVITQAFRDGGTYNRRIVEEAERQLITDFARGGMIVLTPDLQPFRERAHRAWRRYREVWGDSLVLKIQSVR